MFMEVEITPGPGLNRINSEVLNNPMTLLSVIAALGEMLDHWDPHQRLEYMKMAIRTTISEATCREKSDIILES